MEGTYQTAMKTRVLFLAGLNILVVLCAFSGFKADFGEK